MNLTTTVSSISIRGTFHVRCWTPPSPNSVSGSFPTSEILLTSGLVTTTPSGSVSWICRFSRGQSERFVILISTSKWWSSITGMTSLVERSRRRLCMQRMVVSLSRYRSATGPPFTALSEAVAGASMTLFARSGSGACRLTSITSDEPGPSPRGISLPRSKVTIFPGPSVSPFPTHGPSVGAGRLTMVAEGAQGSPSIVYDQSVISGRSKTPGIVSSITRWSIVAVPLFSTVMVWMMSCGWNVLNISFE